MVSKKLMSLALMADENSCLRCPSRRFATG